MTKDRLTIKRSPSSGPGSPDVTGIHDPETGSIQYIVACPETSEAALIDVVQGYDPASARLDTEIAERVLDLVADRGLTVTWVLDTHPHADHVMASTHLKDRTGAPNAIGEKVADIADLWRGFYNLPEAFDVARDFDHLFADGDQFRLGAMDVRVMLSPGHTLGSITYVVGRDAAFAHDTFMQPDVGTARADFPGGAAAQLYDSLMAILELPDDMRLFVGHDYGTDTRDGPAWESTVAEQRRDNAHVGGGITREAYVALRDRRDSTLPLPDRMLAALQLNLRAGRKPPAEGDGHAYLKIPLDKF